MSSHHIIAKGQFYGTSPAYFRLFLLQLLYIFLTAGFALPWAWVQSKKYLVSAAYFGPYQFDYHAKAADIFPLFTIIYSSLIVYIAAGYIYTSYFYSFLLPLFLLKLFFLMPWLILQGLRYHYASISFANIRFSFKGSYWKIFAISYLIPVASLLTLGFAFPYLYKVMKEYFISQVHWGHMRLGTYLIPKKAYISFYILNILSFLFSVFLVSIMIAIGNEGENILSFIYLNLIIIVLSAIFLPFLLMFFTPISYIFFNQLMMVHIVQNLHASIPRNKEETANQVSYHYQSFRLQQNPVPESNRFLFLLSTQSSRKTFWMSLLNVCLCPLTCGLYLPIATIFFLRYQFSCLSLCGDPDLITQNMSTEKSLK